MEPSGLSAVRRGHPQRPRYETPVWTDTCTEWSPLGCQLSGEGTHRDSGTDRHLYRMEPSGLSAVRRGHPQRPRYGQTLVQNGALWAVSRQARVPTETSVRTDSCTEWSPLGCQPSAEGTHSDLLRTDTCTLVQNGALRAVRRGPQRPRYGQTLVQNAAVSRQARAPTETHYGQTLVQNGAVRAVSRQARTPTETPVRTDTCKLWSPPGCQARAPTETAVRTDTCTEWSPPGCEPSDEGTHRDPSTDRHLYRMEPSGLSAVRRGHPQRTPVRAVRRGHPQRPQYGQTLVQNGALRAVSRQTKAPTDTPVRTDTCTEWSPQGCQPSDEGTHRGPRYGLSGEGTHRGTGTDRHLYRMDPSGLSTVRRGYPQSPRYGQTLGQNGALWAVAVRRGHPQRPWYGLTLVQNGAVRAVGRQARAPTETPVRTDTCTEWSPPGSQPSGEGTHRDPGTDRHLYRMEPSGLSGEGTYRDPSTDRHLYRMEPSGLSAVR
ncbi:hypothetical protein NDU88_006662 [Pleurodeles waltl]|uniref:Uncharacterized protein n=1 Tax=Pleurodeles waltl TaxID=8319 RepID=A0AAV7L4F4_PLEWA|nr:hypothetical protein NDU88_006662 [Pleurodeles waltl]